MKKLNSEQKETLYLIIIILINAILIVYMIWISKLEDRIIRLEFQQGIEKIKE